jgi:hypothetical protein
MAYLTEQPIREKRSAAHRLEIVFPNNHGLTLRRNADIGQITRVMARISHTEARKDDVLAVVAAQNGAKLPATVTDVHCAFGVT